MMDIRAVFIDVDNTLLDFDLSSRQAIELVCKDEGIEFTDKMVEVFLEVSDMLWKKVEKGIITKADIYRDRWKLIFQRLGINADGERFDLLYRQKMNLCAVEIDGARELLEYLSGKYTLFSASNASHERLVGRLGAAGLDKFFNDHFSSQRLDALKPDKEFFGRALKIAGFSAEESIVIGDSLTADIAGGKNAGMRTCYFDFAGKEDACQMADFAVKSLLEIKNIL